MSEQLGGRLELTAARARALFAGRFSGTSESAAAGGPPGATDAARIADRIARESGVEPAAARVMAADLVARAQQALTKIVESDRSTLQNEEAIALESVIHVRGRPAVRVLGERLEGLDRHPGSELWQNLIADYERMIIAAAKATGAAIVSDPQTGNPSWVQGSAWLARPDRVVTNRHVLLSMETGVNLLDPSGTRLRDGCSMTIEFGADDRDPRKTDALEVTSVLYVSPLSDPVDIAVLAIQPQQSRRPLGMLPAGTDASSFLFVVGHPAPMSGVPDEVQAVFGKPDGRKRVSFGKLLDVKRPGEFVHDASTVGGFSGAPVLNIADGVVSGLHYYGDPVGGNIAVTSAALRAHQSFGVWGA